MTIAYGILIFFSLLAYLEMRTRLHHGCLIRLISLHLYYTFRTNVHSLDFLFVYVYLVGLFVCFESMQGILFFLHFFFSFRSSIHCSASASIECHWMQSDCAQMWVNCEHIKEHTHTHTHQKEANQMIIVWCCICEYYRAREKCASTVWHVTELTCIIVTPVKIMTQITICTKDVWHCFICQFRMDFFFCFRIALLL